MIEKNYRPTFYKLKDATKICVSEGNFVEAESIQGGGFSWSNREIVALRAPVTVLDSGGVEHPVKTNSQDLFLVPYGALVEPPSPWPPGE